MKIAFLFPGQGAQAVGMGRALVDAEPSARAVYDEADAAVSGLARVILDGPEDELKRTQNTQPAILTTSIACLRALEARGVPAPSFVAGHSLGEYSALVAVGALPFADAVRAVRARGTFMQEAVPEGQGAMAAVLGLDEAGIVDALKPISGDASSSTYCAVANLNGPGQTVIAGRAAGVERATVLLKEKGAKRVMPLPVSAPFHCALMAPVKPRLADVLAKIAFVDVKVPVVTNVEAAPNANGARAKELLVEQVVAPVRFTEIGQRLFDEGVTHFVEVGPGKTLIGILKRMDKERTYLNVESPESLAATVAALGA